MSLSLAQKTAHLKWLKAIRASSGAVPQEPQARDCDCRIWLKQQARKQAVHKPRVAQAKPVELVLLASAAPKSARNFDYNRRFEQGEANWYHIPVSSLQDYTDEQVQAIAYLAVGVTKVGVADRTAPYLYSVHEVSKMPRHMLTVAQAGTLKASEEDYWLFELPHSVPLAHPIQDFVQPFSAKIAKANDLLHTHSFTALADVKENSHV